VKKNNNHKTTNLAIAGNQTRILDLAGLYNGRKSQWLWVCPLGWSSYFTC